MTVVHLVLKSNMTYAKAARPQIKFVCFENFMQNPQKYGEDIDIGLHVRQLYSPSIAEQNAMQELQTLQKYGKIKAAYYLSL